MNGKTSRFPACTPNSACPAFTTQAGDENITLWRERPRVKKSSSGACAHRHRRTAAEDQPPVLPPCWEPHLRYEE